ncbi:MAG: N-acetylmuramoyl-L-alanine amidase [Alphaproteobacteria bacterium]|nr:N-acetylmuramoyl-L-alanine amidase [Alphaproteobacteria bacterium]
MTIQKSLWAILSLCLLLIWSTPASALDIKSLRFGSHPDKIRLVVDMDNTVDFRVFTLSQPYRLVIDLPEFSWHTGATQTPPNAIVSDIRQGQLMPGISRIVFDLKAPATVQNAFLLPSGNGQNNTRLVIDYKKVSFTAFKEQTSTIHGTLKVENYKSPSGTTTRAKSYATIKDGIPHPPSNAIRPRQNNRDTVVRNPVIILDPGHGGVDPGAIGKNGVYEKTVVLSIAKELKRQLLSTGKYQVYVTRETDTFIKLRDRVKFARNHGGDLFISLHADSIKKKNVRGTSIYTLSKKSSDAQTAALARKENQADLIAGVDLNIEDEQVAFILGDFLMNETMNQSKFLANTIVRTLNTQGIKVLQNPHRYAGFAVLKAPDIPSVLIETGFMSNPSEARLLTQKEHQTKIASSIRKGINAYFKHVTMNEQN